MYLLVSIYCISLNNSSNQSGISVQSFANYRLINIGGIHTLEMQDLGNGFLQESTKGSGNIRLVQVILCGLYSCKRSAH
jgi:hypothetical protein